MFYCPEIGSWYSGSPRRKMSRKLSESFVLQSSSDPLLIYLLIMPNIWPFLLMVWNATNVTMFSPGAAFHWKLSPHVLSRHVTFQLVRARAPRGTETYVLEPVKEATAGCWKVIQTLTKSLSGCSDLHHFLLAVSSALSFLEETTHYDCIKWVLAIPGKEVIKNLCYILHHFILSGCSLPPNWPPPWLPAVHSLCCSPSSPCP